MASVITIAFEGWKAQEAASGKPVLLNEFVFANVPNLDPNKPIDRNEKLPPANQIVHRQAVNKAGLASENAVAYSVTLGADVGDFDFNWIGLLNKESNTVAMITHAPSQKKLKTQNGQQGNVLIRSFLLEFQGAAEETQIKTSAETWQIDFTARLTGIDEMQRLINVDSYGVAAFFDESFEVTRSGEQFTVKKGLGYVGGLRGQLEQNQILNNLRNTKVYADFSYQGNIVSQWRTTIKITAAATLNNYVDNAGFTHQVFAIASIDASGNVKDLRPMGALSSQEISALETRFKLDLSKKIDKANITSQTGNNTELVVNQHLLTTELGKKQPVGNYAPAGDYATNVSLKSGLDGKLNKLRPEADELLKVKSAGDYASISLVKKSGERVDIETLNDPSTTALNLIYRDASGKNISIVSVPKRYGSVMLAGDGGWMKDVGAGTGGVKTLSDYRLNSIGYAYAATQLGTYKSGNHHVFNVFGYTTRDFGVQFAFLNDGRLGYRNIENNTVKPWQDIYTTVNTQIDRNGNLKASGSTERSDCQVGIPLPWPQTIAPAGYLICNGQSFDKTKYPLLSIAYPLGVLPDLRGEFIRGLSAGRNVDAGRTILSAQASMIGKHSHDFLQKISNANGGSEQHALRTLSDNGFVRDKTFSTNESGGDETRPRNIAFLYIVRAA